jgi:hypothetical protein
MTGVPAQAQTQSARAGVRYSDEAPAAIKSLLNRQAFISPVVGFLAQAQKLAAAYNSYFSLGVARKRVEPEAVPYQNSKALVEQNRVLIVTHLPRAALSDSLAKASGELS